MAIEVDTKDCTALSDAELAEMADLCADGTLAYEVGTLSKQAEAWVLITQAARTAMPPGLLVLHPRAHRRHAVRADRPGLGQAHARSGTRRR